MDADGNTKDDLKLPSGTDEAEKLAVTIQAEFDAGKELTVVVLKVLSAICGRQLVCGCVAWYGQMVLRTLSVSPGGSSKRLALSC